LDIQEFVGVHDGCALPGRRAEFRDSARRPLKQFAFGAKQDIIAFVLKSGDLISYNSRRAHKIWNYGQRKVRTLWFNLDREP